MGNRTLSRTSAKEVLVSAVVCATSGAHCSASLKNYARYLTRFLDWISHDSCVNLTRSLLNRIKELYKTSSKILGLNLIRFLCESYKDVSARIIQDFTQDSWIESYLILVWISHSHHSTTIAIIAIGLALIGSFWETLYTAPSPYKVSFSSSHTDVH